MTDRHEAPPLTLVRTLRDRSETRHQHARAASRGNEVRVLRGAYATREEWDARSIRDRYLLTLDAFLGTRRHTIPLFSHWSAAVLHEMPLIGDVPDGVHISIGRTSSARTTRGVVRHSTEVPAEDIVDVGGRRCTSEERTIVDIAAVAPTADAVVLADHFLRRHASGTDSVASLDRGALLASWTRALPFRGHRRALDVIAFGDARAESPLESLSRVSMHAIGAPRPDLQESFADRSGPIGRVDFWWPENGVVGEADGAAKYLDPALRGGRSADRVVLDEKRREDRLRALGLTVVRWGWETARNPQLLANALHAAGLPIDPRRRWAH